ncbi:hypothetical protein K1719_044500 [Acacia pycnantha]|nr:hypothetical protein K1719_044500 [Acacia pycnantha]
MNLNMNDEDPRQEQYGLISAEPKHASKAREATVSFAKKLLIDHKYVLDFLKSTSSAIWSITYGVLKSIIRNMPQAFSDGNLKTLAGAILGAFNEKEPTCHSSMWDAVLPFFNRKRFTG